MGTVLTFLQPFVVAFEDYPEGILAQDQVRLRTIYSGISAGTEMSQFRGTNPYTQKRWDPETRLFLGSNQPSQSYPLRGFGYEEVSEVIEVGSEVRAVHLGDLIYGTWGHRTTQIITEEYAARRVLPAGLDPILGIFSHIGSIALNGVLDAQLHIGETVSIFGLGVPGQIVAMLAKKSGARVIGIDPLDQRLVIAQGLGSVDIALNPRRESPAETIKNLTAGLGADVSIEVSGIPEALNEAIRATAYSSTVVALGFFQGEAQGVYLGEEFHHHRINLVCSQISGSAPQISHRWNRERLVQTVMRMQAEGVLNLRPMITQVFPFHQAGEAYRLLDEHPEGALQVVLDFETAR